ncbi:hypothetical protein RB200_27530 [Streptomyces sp. PmtG]
MDEGEGEGSRIEGGLDGVPRQGRSLVRQAVAGGGPGGAASGSVDAGTAAVALAVAEPPVFGGPGASGPGAGSGVSAAAGRPALGEPSARPHGPWPALRGLRPWRLLPTPVGTPFTFGYAMVLLVTSTLTEYADPSLISSMHQGSSTDVAHLADRPVFVLVASALWVAGGITSPYAIGFLFVLTALERRTGPLRAAGVFLLGHVVATLATEIPVGLSVLAGHLPGTSLQRLDYGISFGVAASVGALAGLVAPWLRWTMLAGFGWLLVEDLIAFADPMTNWGHLLALAVGVATWPLLRGGQGRGAEPRRPH